MDEQTSVVLIQALAQVWQSIRAHHPQVPGVMLLPAPAPAGRLGSRVLGYFAPLRWRTRQGDGALMHEVVVVGEHLNRSAEDVLETLLHEAAHALNFARNIRDCTASQYHNSHFKRAAEELGLEVQRVPNYGYALTRMRLSTPDRYFDELAVLDAALIHRRTWRANTKSGGDGSDPGDNPTASAPRSRYLKATCRCGFNIRAARSTFTNTVIRCESCDAPFERA